MTSPVPRAWRRALEILRWRGPGHFFLLALREVLRPVLYWNAWNIYLTDLQVPLTEPYAKGKFDVRIFAGDKDREMAREQLASLGEPLPINFDARVNRGDALAIVRCGSEPVAFGWMTFSSGMELAYGTTWILQPNEGTQYGAFVVSKWRGHGIFSVMNVALNTYAREHGVLRSVGSISVLNSQSLSMAKRLRKKKIMTVILVRVRGVGWTFQKAIGAPLHTRFVGKDTLVGGLTVESARRVRFWRFASRSEGEHRSPQSAVLFSARRSHSVSAGPAYHSDRCNFQMAMLSVIALNASVFRRFLRIFLHVVQLLMRHYARCGHGLTNMLGKRYTAIAAMNFPRASVFPGKEVFISSAFGFR